MDCVSRPNVCMIDTSKQTIVWPIHIVASAFAVPVQCTQNKFGIL